VNIADKLYLNLLTSWFVSLNAWFLVWSVFVFIAFFIFFSIVAMRSKVDVSPTFELKLCL